jgi:hypothetical protein
MPWYQPEQGEHRRLGRVSRVCRVWSRQWNKMYELRWRRLGGRQTTLTSNDTVRTRLRAVEFQIDGHGGIILSYRHRATE